MACSKNVGKAKASSFSMGQAVKKIKSDASQPVKKGKGKRIASSSESESSDDDEIEAMFAEDSESDQEKWARSIANRGFHCERGVKLETFLYSHPIRGIIQEQNLHFVHTEVHGYLPSVVQDSDRPYPLRAITDFDAQLFTEAMCTRPVPMSGFVKKEFVPRKLKPEYALMNKIIHDRIGPKGNEKSPSREQIQFLYEFA